MHFKILLVFYDIHKCYSLVWNEELAAHTADVPEIEYMLR